MTLRLDDLLALLPQTDLRVWRMDQSDDGWHVCLETNRSGVWEYFSGDAPTPAEAMLVAFAKAGFNIEDDGT